MKEWKAPKLSNLNVSQTMNTEELVILKHIVGNVNVMDVAIQVYIILIQQQNQH